jgi:1,4-dihydroxy-2-naphthoyl-CoA hydrolase
VSSETLHIAGFDALYGLELLALDPEAARAQVKVRDELKQPYGLVYGGVFAAVAESLASIATARAVKRENRIAVGLSNQTSFLRPITDGTIHALAVARHRGRSTWVWEVEMSDDAGRVCVLTRMTVAVRDR